jgi:hypothetical protein
VIDGNDHDYERFAGQNPDQTGVTAGSTNHSRLTAWCRMRIPTECCASSCTRQATTGDSFQWRGGPSRMWGPALAIDSCRVWVP